MTQNSWNSEFNITKGSLLVGNNSKPVSLAVGANGTVLTADSAQATGVAWSTVPPTFASLFSAYWSGSATDETGDGTVYFMNVNQWTATTNVGSNFNATTGTYTAPATGTYLFNWSVYTTGYLVAHTAAQASLYNATTATSYTGTQNSGFVSAAGNTDLVQCGSIIIPLTAADTVYTYSFVSGGTKVIDLPASGATNTRTWFTGVRLA
jgi:hypothetical protein